MYFEFLILLCACRAQPVCLPVIQAQAYALNQTTLKHWQFFSLLLGITLVSAWAQCLGAGADCLLGDSAAAGQLYPTRHSHDDQQSAHQQDQATSPSQQHSACCERACEGLGHQVGVLMMSCKIFKQSCQVLVQRFYQRDKTKS
jgi:hypothetical protein